MWVKSLGQEDPLEEGMTTHFSIPAWRILWTEEPGRLQPMGLQESDTTQHLNQIKSEEIEKKKQKPDTRSGNLSSKSPRSAAFNILCHGSSG